MINLHRKFLKALLWGLEPLRQLRRRHAPRLGLSLIPPLIRAKAFLRYGWRRSFERHQAGSSVTVAGLHGSIVGIGEGARATATALRNAGLEVYDWDLSAIFSHPRHLIVGDPRPPAAGPGVIIVQMNANELVRLVGAVGAAPFVGKRCIGYWAWELETIPTIWRHAFHYVDEIWTPSDFTSEAVRRSAPRRVKIRTLHHPIKAPNGVPNRARFGLPARGVAVLAAFDIRSSIARKNPHAVIAAFEAATRDDPSHAFLILKVAGLRGNEVLFDAIRERTSSISNIHLLTESLSEADRDNLVQTADIVVSLHRSEGFGLLMAEAMLAGKPVVATGWSGNLDFMSPDAARLVPFKLIPVVDTQGLFVHGRWAEPDIAVAAEHLRELIASEPTRRALGEAGQRHAKAVLDVDAISRQAEAWVLGEGAPQGRSTDK